MKLFNVHTSPYIEPIRIVRTLLFEGARFDEIDPTRDLELAGAFQVGGIGLNE
jgi:hypothetical protein